MKRCTRVLTAGALFFAGMCAAVCLQGPGGGTVQQEAETSLPVTEPQQEEAAPPAAEEEPQQVTAVYTVRSQDGTVCIFRNGELAVHTSIPVLLLGKEQRRLLEDGVVVTAYTDILLLLTELGA